MREKLFKIIEVDENHLVSHIYDIVMMISIILSLLPLAMKEVPSFFRVTEIATTVLFVIDYILRFLTADYKLRRGKMSFLLYPFTPMAIIDLLSVLPTLILISEALRVLKVIRFVRALRVLKILKSFRYSKNIAMIASVFRREKRSLMTVGVLAVGYILISALLVFNIEPETFATFFDAVYWATVSLTTVGYGDIYTTGVLGRIITMISSVLGVAIVALPAGIITAGYMKEIEQSQTDSNKTGDNENG